MKSITIFVVHLVISCILNFYEHKEELQQKIFSSRHQDFPLTVLSVVNSSGGSVYAVYSSKLFVCQSFAFIDARVTVYVLC